MKDTLSQMVRLGLLILLLAVVLFWADSSYFAPRRLPPCVQEKLPEGHICLENLRSEWKDRVVWIDARSESDFEVNHLMFPDNRMFPIRKGAALQQLMDAAIERMVEAAERNECIVVFCTSGCTSSDEIADELRGLGLVTAPIYVLEGGWPVLKASGMVKL